MSRGWKQADDIAQAVWRPFSVMAGSPKQGLKQRERERSRCRGSLSRETRSRFCCSARAPDVLAADNQAQIDKLERAMSVLGEDSVDAAGLIATLKKVRAQSIQPIGERLDACQQFVEKARKRFLAAEDAVMKA